MSHHSTHYLSALGRDAPALVVHLILGCNAYLKLLLI